MLSPIRVVPDRPTDTMDPMSRLNFTKVYTVEKNILVGDFGTIYEQDLARFKDQFKIVWERDG